MSEHTPEPWRAAGTTVLAVAAEGKFVAECGPNINDSEANARRIVACVNACKDWETELLEAWAADPSSPLLTNELTRLHDAVTERDARIIALERERDNSVRAVEDLEVVVGEARDIIARVKAGKA